MNKIKIGFFSFTEITDPGEHRSYNEWHMLDHMPEQYPIPGIAYGQRWVSTPACRRARLADDPMLAPTHYLTCYYMTEPVERTLVDFVDWGGQLRGLGRFHQHRRGLLGGPFLFLKAYAAPRVLVSPEAIPYRPNRGIFVYAFDLLDESAADPVASFLDRVFFPDLLTVDGVAGVWSFQSRGGGSEHFAHANPPGRRIALVYLDAPPLTVTETLRQQSARWREEGRHPDLSKSLATLFAGPLETITPWQWSWFDSEA